MKHDKINSESGVALVATLCLLFTAGLLTSAVVALSQLNTIDVLSGIDYARSRYVAEGAANRIQWLITADRYTYTDNQIGELTYSDYDTDRYLPDGVKHTIDYYGTPVEFVIEDTVSGMNINDLSNEFSYLKLAAEEDTTYSDELDTLANRYTDYTDDGDETADSDSYEAADYEDDLNAYPLPRNAALQYREEMLYIPGFRELFPPDADGRLTAFMLLPPINMTISNTSKPSIMTATKEQIMGRANLTEEQADTVLEAILLYKTENKLVSDILEATVLEAVQQNFLWTESENYTVKILRSAPKGRSSCRLVFSFTAFDAAGPDEDIVEFLEYFFY